MIRLLAFAFGALALAACAPRAVSGACDFDVSRTLAFTAADAEDSLQVRSLGPTCDKAIGLFVLRTADGFPVWSWSAPLAHRFGDAFGPQDHEQMQDFLRRWAEPRLTTTETAPAWASLPAGETTLDQLTYEDVRARNLPMLCHFSGTARETCVFWEPAAGGAGHMFDRDVVEESQG